MKLRLSLDENEIIPLPGSEYLTEEEILTERIQPKDFTVMRR